MLPYEILLLPVDTRFLLTEERQELKSYTNNFFSNRRDTNSRLHLTVCTYHPS